ncbi:MAG: hypothetical protein WD448_08095 [Woeseia sp.]
MTATPEMNATTAATPRRRVGFAVLLALAWFQVAFASHQFEHVTGDLFDSCTVCKHLERQDSAAVQKAPDSAPALLFLAPMANAASHNPARLHRNYHSRAPPSA